MSERPHIVIFNPDQWRGDVLGFVGNPAAVTPNLDRAVATDSVAFKWAFCQNPVSTPSRCSFMTGWYPHVRGHRTMFHMLRDGEPCLLRTLKQSGYHVFWSGKNDLVPAQHGYEASCNEKFEPTAEDFARWGYGEGLRGSGWNQARGNPEDDTFFSFYVGRVGEAGAPKERIYLDDDWAMVLGAIDRIKNAPPDKPLCVYLPLGFPHPPYHVEDPYYSMIDRRNPRSPRKLPRRIPAPTSGGWRGKPSLLKGIYEGQRMQTWTEDRWTELRATYYGMCARVDAQYGMVMQALRDAGIYDDTAVFFFADHGDFTGDYGLVEKTQNTFEDCLTRVPFVIKPPASVPCLPGVRDVLAELIDFPATVEALVDIEKQHDHFGRSLLPLIAGEVDEHRDAVFCEGGRLKHEKQCMETESDREGDVHGSYWPRLALQRSDGPEHSKATMCRTKDFKYVRRMYESDELYDLKKDPGEQRNVIDDPAYAEVLIAMKEHMLQFYHETSDVVPFDPDERWEGQLTKHELT